jgi:hypothetical protein
MRFSVILTGLAAAASAIPMAPRGTFERKYTIELAPGETRVVSEAEKLALKAVGGDRRIVRGSSERTNIHPGRQALLRYHQPP